MKGSVVRSAVAIACIACAMSGLTLHASADTTTTDEERAAEVKLLKLINHGRQTRDHRVLVEHETILTEARAQSERMANQQTLSHTALEARQQRIADSDSGIDATEICENVANADTSNMKKAMKGIFRAWKGDEAKRDCMYGEGDYTTESAAVGIEQRDGVFWVTFIAAHDTTPARTRR